MTQSTNMAASTSSVLTGIGILLLGNGFLGTLLGVRGHLYGFSPFTLGLVMSAYYLGSLAGTYLCPLLVRQVGYIRTFTALAAVVSASALTHAVVIHSTVWMLLRFLNGMALFGLLIVVESWLNVVSTNRTRGRLFAVYMAVTLGAIAAGQFLLVLGGDDPYLPFALASLMITLALVPVALNPVAAPEPHPTTAFGVVELYTTSPLGFVGTLLSGLAAGAFFGLGAVFAKRHGLNPAEIAGFMAAIIVGGAVLQRPVGYLSDKFDRRRVLLIAAFSAAALSLLLLVCVSLPVYTLFPAGFLYGGCAFPLYSLSVAHTNDRVASEHVLEATRGLLMVYGAGGALGPITAGLFMDLYVGGLMVFFLVNWLALGLFAVYDERRIAPVPMEEQSPFVLIRDFPVALELHPEREIAGASAPGEGPVEAREGNRQSTL